MRRTLRASACLLAIVVSSGGCGKKSSSGGGGGGGGSGGSSGGGTNTTYNVAASSPIHLAQAFDANTPASFKTSSSSLSLLDACQTQYGSGTPATTACETMADIQNRFFTAGPTNIHNLLANFDSSLNGTLESLSSSYVPCLDAIRTTSGTFNVMQAGVGTSSITYPPYALTAVPLKTTFLDSFALDTGDGLSLSCFDAGNGGNAKTGVGTGYGVDSSGTWSLYSAAGTAGGAWGTADKDDNIEMWYAVGQTTGQDAQEKTQGSAIYNGSTGIVQIISKPSLGVIGLAQVGVGVGPGCGAQLLMNSSTLYFTGNVNNYGACTASDYGASGPGGTPAYSASLDAVSVCMNVSGTTTTPTPDLSACVDSGLISLDDSGNVVSPFAAAGLKYLTADENSAVAGAIKIRAWMASFFMRGQDLSAIPPLGTVQLGASDTLNPSGYSRMSFAMNRTTAAAHQITDVAALCTATGAALQAPLAETFELTVADLTTAQQKIQSTVTATSLAQQITTALGNTGSAAAVMEIPITGTKGTTFVGNFTGTATVSIDGTQVGTATLALPATSGVMSQTALVTLPTTATVTATSKFDVAVSGTLSLHCNNADAVQRTVSVKPAVPSLVWFHQQKAGS